MNARPSRSSVGRPFSATRTHPNSPPKTASNGTAYPEIKQRGYYSDILGEGASSRIGVLLNYFISCLVTIE